MEEITSSIMFPLHSCKILHLLRHAQAIHNVEGEKNHDAYLSPTLFDSQLSSLGWEQVSNFRKHVQASGLGKRIDLVVVSPLLRTMLTAAVAFGGENYVDGVNCPPFIAVETCRERMGVHPCDKRRSISEYRSLFPAIDFSLIESDGDSLWRADKRESNEELAARGMKFFNWLWTRKEKEIAVVSHSSFLFQTLQKFGNDCHPSVNEEIRKSFANCELRSMVLVERRMIGLDNSTTNYPGKVPHGLDLPSDAMHEKNPEKTSGDCKSFEIIEIGKVPENIKMLVEEMNELHQSFARLEARWESTEKRISYWFPLLILLLIVFMYHVSHELMENHLI